jgi:hypothetical protein
MTPLWVLLTTEAVADVALWALLRLHAKLLASRAYKQVMRCVQQQQAAHRAHVQHRVSTFSLAWLLPCFEMHSGCIYVRRATTPRTCGTGFITCMCAYLLELSIACAEALFPAPYTLPCGVTAACAIGHA